MASTLRGSQLTEAHRLLQARLSKNTVDQLRVDWELVDPLRVDATMEGWLRAALATIDRQRKVSATIAARYQQQFRIAEIGKAIDLPTPTPLPLEAATTSLIVQGPVRYRALLAAGRSSTEASTMASATSAVAGTRHVLNGGRDLLMEASDADPLALGSRRVCSAGCCAFCAMLAASWVDGASGDNFQAHDNCHCQPESSYEEGAQHATRQAKEFHALYHESTSGVGGGGSNKLNAFRQALAAQRRA